MEKKKHKTGLADFFFQELFSAKATIALCSAIIISFFLLSNNPFFLDLNIINSFSFSLSRFWNIFPYVFVHNSFVHLLANVSAILVFGFLLEKRIGFRKTVLLFAVSATLPAILFSIINPQYSIFGASAVSSGLIGAGILLQPKKTVIAAILLVFVVVFLVKPLGMGIFEDYKKSISTEIARTAEQKTIAEKSGETIVAKQLEKKEVDLKQFLDSLQVREIVAASTGVANAAHVFGGITGFAFAYFFVPNRFRKQGKKIRSLNSRR